ncbi:hypothetical protein [Halopiger xanaduensis]|uniref:hypothetical protein n=1 Tax=Halopiger xanaduensis TaxID=387343 RepID=UPI000677FB11|nr:hypothetical protein [Halopiger xanaduensis]
MSRYTSKSYWLNGKKGVHESDGPDDVVIVGTWLVTPERNTLEEGLIVQRVIKAIYRSSETGRSVRPN